LVVLFFVVLFFEAVLLWPFDFLCDFDLALELLLLLLFVLEVGVTLVVTVVVFFAPGTFVVVVFVVLTACCAATTGVATKAIAATEAINFFIASSCLR
jgi:hypothetical protein